MDEARRGDGVVQRQLAAVIGDGRGVDAVERQQQIAQRQVGLCEDALHLPGQAVGLGVLAGEDRRPHRRQHVARGGVIARPRPARPERLFVQLQPLLCDAAEDHRAQPAIADGQRLDPGVGRGRIPEGEIGLAHAKLISIIWWPWIAGTTNSIRPPWISKGIASPCGTAVTRVTTSAARTETAVS